MGDNKWQRSSPLKMVRRHGLNCSVILNLRASKTFLLSNKIPKKQKGNY